MQIGRRGWVESHQGGWIGIVRKASDPLKDRPSEESPALGMESAPANPRRVGLD